MPQTLLWVESATGQDQQSITSARQQNSRIRSHVQGRRRDHVPETNGDKTLDDQSKVLQQSDCVKGVPASSLRPSRSLGRLALKSADSVSRKRKMKAKIDSKNPSIPIDSSSANRGLALSRSLSLLWHGLSSSERRSLAFFELRTSQEWSGWQDAHFWNVLALQVSQESQAVARSLIAVSALHERMEAMGDVERKRLQGLICEQSSKATSALLARSEVPYFEALVSCLIMICFHGLQHSRASFLLLRSGVKLLAECDDPARTSCSERQMVNLQLRPLFTRLLSRPCELGNLCRSFALSVRRYRAKGLPDTSERPVIPSAFSTLSEARQCLQHMLDWAHDCIAMPSDGEDRMEIFLGSLHQLRDAWEVSLAQSDQPKTVESIRSQKLLRAACLVCIMVVETAHCTYETVYDKYQAVFEEVLSLVEGARSSGHSFGIDAGLLDIVAFVGSKCRDPQVRRRALRLLRSGCRLEGDRIATNPARILEALIALEERGLQVESCHDVPENNRRDLICGQQHIAHGRIDLFYESADGSQKDRCCVSLAGGSGGKPRKKINTEASVPDVIFGAGYAAYLEDWQTMSYFRLELDRFHFLMPKV